MECTTNARRLVAATDLLQGLAVHEVELRLQVGLRLRDAGHGILAFYLADMDIRGLHQALGFSSTAFYAEARLGLSRRRARELVRAGTKLRELPRIDAAFRAQEIGWSKVIELVRVAVPQHEGAWLERARALTVRQLRQEVALSQEGAAPRKPGDRKALVNARFSIHAKVSALVHRKWDTVKRKLSEEVGMPLDEADVMELLADLGLATEDDGTTPGRKPARTSIFRIPLHDCGEGKPPEVDTELGRVPVEGCGCKHCHDEDDIDRKTPLWMRLEVLGKDGNACRCCGSRHRLHVHHVDYRSHGGRTCILNLITLCARCHGLVHEDLLVLVGPDSGHIRFQDAKGRDLHEPDGYVPAAVLIRMTPPEPAPRPESDPEQESKPEPAPEPMPLEEAFAGIVGQDARLTTFERASKGSRARGHAFPHTLLVGPPGTGKTTLAEGIARLLGARLIRTCGPLLDGTDALVRLLAGLQPGDALFLDEAHALPRSVQETLYEAMEKRRLLDQDLPPFTVLAATTEDGDLPAPFRHRFGLVEHLGFYEDGDLADLARAGACAEDVTLTPGAAADLAAFAHGTPRELIRLLDRVLDEAAAEGLDDVDANVARRVLHAMGYDDDGHDPAQQAYLRLLERSPRPLSLHRIATSLGLSVRTVLERVEPPLLRAGRVEVTRRGRTASRRPRGSGWTGASMIRDRARPASAARARACARRAPELSGGGPRAPSPRAPGRGGRGRASPSC